jgi:hypothetical protein
MKESLVALRQLLVSDQKLPKSVEPGVCGFHDPTTVLRRPPAPPLLSCDPRSVPAEPNLLTNRLTVISLIRIQEGAHSLRTGDDDCIEHGNELSDVMSMSPGDDQRQRDTTGVHEEMALASLFSPDLSGLDRLFPEQGVP